MRLNYTHFFVTKVTGYLLHSKIPKDEENIRVADVGTGTGIWPSELAVELPSSAVIDAFDVSSAQFPPQGWHTPNVNFKTHDCFEPFPIEHIQQYDIVNVRFWLCILNDDTARPLLDNVLTLLKPGGHIQWFEAIPSSAHVKARNGGVPTPACNQLVEKIKKPHSHSSYDWVEGLPLLLEERNVEVVARERYEKGDLYQTVSSQIQLAGLDEYIHFQKEDGVKAVKEFQDQLASEFADGAFVDFAYTCVVGRKSE